MLAPHSCGGEDPAEGACDGGGPRPVGGAEERARAKPSGDAVDPVVAVAGRDHGALDPGVHEADDAQRVPDTAAGAAAGVEHAVGADLGGLPWLGAPGGVAEAQGGAADGAREVPDARVESEVLTPRAPLRQGLLLEEELRRGGQVVERPVAVGHVEVLVRIVQPAFGVGGVGAVVGTGREHPRVRHGGGGGGAC